MINDGIKYVKVQDN